MHLKKILLINNNKKVKSLLKIGLVALAGLAGIFLFFMVVSPSIQVQKGPNVVIILIDTLRADHCSVYGYNRETTPHMTRIAESGLKLENHFVNSPWTKPSTASIISGLYPTAHGSRIGQFEDLQVQVAPVVEVLNPRVNTMAEILKKNGYSTHAFITNYHMTPRFGYAQGYEHYYFDSEGAEKSVVCQKDRELVELAIKALQNKKDKPVFIWCHLMAVHGYRFPGAFHRFHPEHSSPIPTDAKQSDTVKNFNSIEEVVANYDNSILYADHLVGEFFDFILTSAPDTIFIVTSDHGEEFYEHGGFEHARTLYNEILKVPCIIWGPGVPAGVFTGLSDSIDLMPTIMKNLRIKVSSDLRGQILFYQNKISSENIKEVFAEQHHRGDYKRFAVIRQGKKMIVNQHKNSGKKVFEFYNDGLSIEKMSAISRVDPKMINQFKQTIIRYQTLTTQYFTQNVGELEYKDLTPKDVKHLKSLGYIE